MSTYASESHKAATIMLQGTASDVGKSLLATALCRVFRQDGHRTAPFKSQNMSLNAYTMPDGKQIGQAQAMQADACGIAPSTDMNPILLKPTGNMSSQVVVHGERFRDLQAKAYREEYLPIAEGIVREALDRLRSRHDIVVIEGAGSPAEVNLKDRDIVNMRLAGWADAPVILVADIDRGGVFASIVGTLEILEPHERDRVQGFIINKFRGDVRLLKPGLDWLEERTGKPVLGVVPFLADLRLEDEDSLSLDSKIRYAAPPSSPDQLDIAVIKLPLIADVTELAPLQHEPDVHLRFIESAQQWHEPDAVIVPGSNDAEAALRWLRESGMAERIEAFAGQGGAVIGIGKGNALLEQLLPGSVQAASPSKAAVAQRVEGLLSDEKRMVEWKALREREFDRLAGHFRAHVDMERVYGMLRGGAGSKGRNP